MNEGTALKMNEVIDPPCHPFKTEKAKAEYLKLYDARAKKWPAQSTTKMVNTSYGKTFVRISGLHGGEPLVLMHGVGGNSLQWMSNIDSVWGRPLKGLSINRNTPPLGKSMSGWKYRLLLTSVFSGSRGPCAR